MANNQMQLKIRGKAYWAHVHSPETYEGQQLGYSIMVKIDDDKLEALKNKLENLFNEAETTMAKKPNRKKPMNLSIKEDSKAGECIKAKTKHYYKNRETGEITPKTLPVFKKNGEPLEQGVKIGNGSEVIINVTPSPYVVNSSTYGVQLRLNAVQVLNLVEYGTPSAQAFGFDIEDDDEDDTKTGSMSQSTATNEDEELDF